MSERPVDVLRHESEMGTWSMIRSVADSRLQSAIYSYCGWTQDTPDAPLRRHVPGLRVPLIFVFEPDFEVNADTGRADVATIQHAFVAGLHDSYAVTRSGGTEAGVQVDLTPMSARAIFGLPMREITGRAVEAEDVLGRAVSGLAEQLRDLPAWDERFSAIDAYLLRRAADAQPPDARVAWAYRRIVSSGGGQPIRELAESLGWSHRRLVDAFRDEVGLAPKTLARVVRFNRALRFAERNPSSSWADVATATGYYDQPHLVREFVSLSGSTPLDLVARTLPPGGGVQG